MMVNNPADRWELKTGQEPRRFRVISSFCFTAVVQMVGSGHICQLAVRCVKGVFPLKSGVSGSQ